MILASGLGGSQNGVLLPLRRGFGICPLRSAALLRAHGDVAERLKATVC